MAVLEFAVLQDILELMGGIKMAEYLLLKFENELDRINAVTFGELPGHPEIIAVYRAPTVFCDCVSVKNRGWTKGQKWGWWVCDICGKPSKLAHNNTIQENTFGFNLLSHIEVQKEKPLSTALISPEG